jgi:hypothetical protein
LGIWIATVDAELVFQVLTLYELLEGTSSEGLVHCRVTVVLRVESTNWTTFWHGERMHLWEYVSTNRKGHRESVCLALGTRRPAVDGSLEKFSLEICLEFNLIRIAMTRRGWSKRLGPTRGGEIGSESRRSQR